MAGLGVVGILLAVVTATALIVLAVLTPFFVYRIYQEAIETNRLLRRLCPTDGQESAPRTGREFSR